MSAEEEDKLMPVPEQPTADVAFIERPVLSGVVSRHTVNESFNAIVVCREAMLQYITNAHLPGHSLASKEYKQLTQKLVALCAVAGVDAQAEIKSFEYLAKVGGWMHKPKTSHKGKRGDEPDGIDDLFDEDEE